MKTSSIACSGPIGQVAFDILNPFGEIKIANDNSEQALFEIMADAVGLVLRGDGVGNNRIIDAAPNLKVIGRSGVGFDNVDIKKANERGIPVIITPGANSQAVAEASITYMLAFCKKMIFWDTQLKQGNWKSRFEHASGDLQGATLGIVGFGSIGQTLARLVRPFGMQAIYYDPFVDEETAKEFGAAPSDLDGLLKNSDFVSLHTLLNEETRGMINHERLFAMKEGSFLINLSRGPVVESLDSVYQALTDGPLGGCALDVFDPEPPDVSHPIFKLENCLTSPHAICMSERALYTSFKMMAEDMAAVLEGKRPKYTANPEIFE